MVDKSIIVQNLTFRTGDITGLVNEIGTQFGNAVGEIKSILLFVQDGVNFTILPGTFVVEYADAESVSRLFTASIQMNPRFFYGKGHITYYKKHELHFRQYKSIRYGIFSVYL